MKKNDKNPSKNVGTMMRKIETRELEQAAGGGLPGKQPCLTCGLINVWI